MVASGFAVLSYGELREEIEQTRVRLRHAGIDRNARIAVALPTGAEATLAIVAVASSAAAVPLDLKLTFAEVESCLRILRPDAVLLDGDCVAGKVAAQNHVPVIEAVFARDGKLGMQLTVPQIGPAALLDDPDPDAPAFILHTSGTTGDPNLVPLSHGNMLATAARAQSWFALTPQDRCLSVSPIHYAHAITTGVPLLLIGGSIAFPANPSIVELSEWFGSLAPTWYSAGPTLHLAVLEKARNRPDALTLHSLRFISAAGAALPRAVREEMESVLGIPVLEYYGTSETTGPIAVNSPPPGRSKPGTCGIPWPDTVIVVGADGRRLPLGVHGEILVQGPNITAGYLNAPELNRVTFVNGWYRTGDIGSLDADGFITLHGRKREIINRGGEKVAPIEIDQALMRHPDVVEAAAYAVPHPRLGQDVAAAVVLRPGSRATPIELREFLSEWLARFKIPRRISIVDQLPKGLTGKVQRKRLEAAEVKLENAGAWRSAND